MMRDRPLHYASFNAMVEDNDQESVDRQQNEQWWDDEEKISTFRNSYLNNTNVHPQRAYTSPDIQTSSMFLVVCCLFHLCKYIRKETLKSIVN